MHGKACLGYAMLMTEREHPRQERMEEPPRDREDRRLREVNPAHAPVPANPAVEDDEVERGREKLGRVLS